ncbi:ASCH domain-containing protein [Kitasatospora albolonga]|uniref:ASCH domain-containing protein n=1 Tax=Kitasatospora albolonga TaxID=68173 RepID=UPI0031ED8F1C
MEVWAGGARRLLDHHSPDAPAYVLGTSSGAVTALLPAVLDGPSATVPTMDIDALPVFEFAFPGPLRDQLVGAVLSGAKTTTTGLAVDYATTGDPLPRAGHRAAVIDSDGHRVAVIELTEVRVLRLADVDLRHAVDEGEGDETVAQWRTNHESFWHGPEVRAELGPDFTVDDDTEVVAQRFRVLWQAEA